MYFILRLYNNRTPVPLTWNRVTLTFMHLQLNKLLQIPKRVLVDAAYAIVLHTPESSLSR